MELFQHPGLQKNALKHIHLLHYFFLCAIVCNFTFTGAVKLADTIFLTMASLFYTEFPDLYQHYRFLTSVMDYPSVLLSSLVNTFTVYLSLYMPKLDDNVFSKTELG